MISIATGEYGSSGIADLEEAVALAKQQGIANAVDAVHPDIILDLHSIGSMIGAGLSKTIPGVLPNASSMGGVKAESLQVKETKPVLRALLTSTEQEIVRVAGDDLPDWHPTTRHAGARIVSMFGGAIFLEHTDKYEGLVASVQFAVEGQKTMNAKVDDQWEQVPVRQGDVTLFAGDGFSPQSRVPHGFNFEGLFAAAAIIGQDPYYTITGNYPALNLAGNQ